MLWTNVDRIGAHPFDAVLAETTNKTFVVLTANDDGDNEITFESFRLSECVSYCREHGLKVRNLKVDEASERYADQIPCGYLDRVESIRSCYRRDTYQIVIRHDWKVIGYHSNDIYTTEPAWISRIIQRTTRRA